MGLHVTSITAAIAAIMLIGLSIFVSMGRGKAKTDIGDGGNMMLLGRIRAHGNFTETVPMALILLGLCEMAGTGAAWLWTISGLLLIGRALHAYGLISQTFPSRAGGMMMTFASLVVGIVVILIDLI